MLHIFLFSVACIPAWQQILQLNRGSKVDDLGNGDSFSFRSCRVALNEMAFEGT